MIDTSSIIGTGLGLVVVFSLTAILVTQINTIIITFFNLRPKELKRGLIELVTDKEVQAKLLAHPIVSMVKGSVPPTANLTEEDAENIINLPETNVTSIPPSTLAEAMIGILVSDSNTTLFTPLEEAILGLPNSLEKSELRELLYLLRINFSEESIRRVYKIAETISDEKQQRILLEGLQKVEAVLEKLDFNSPDLVALMNGVRKIGDAKLEAALNTILVSARSLSDAQIKLREWFDDGIQRVQASFSRRMQYVSIIVATVLTLLLNIDTVFLARTLYDDPQLRQSVAAVANEFDQTAIIAQITKNEAKSQVASGATFEDLQQQIDSAEETVQNILSLQLPIGWQYTAVTDEIVNQSLELGFPNPRSNPRNIWSLMPWNNSDWLSLWFQKIIGLVATIVAASQGAPFWFDLMNKVASRRPV